MSFGLGGFTCGQWNAPRASRVRSMRLTSAPKLALFDVNDSLAADAYLFREGFLVETGVLYGDHG